MADPLRVDQQSHEPPTLSGYTFGPFRIDVSSYQLLREGQPVELTSKMFDTLLLLVRQRHRVVAKDELLSTIWPDAVVTDDSLIQCVSSLRRALGDDATKPRYVATVARRGYRFIAPATEWSEPVIPVPPSADRSTQATVALPLLAAAPATRWTSPPRIIALACVAAALVLLGWRLGRGSTVAAPASAGLLRFNQDAPAGTKLVSGGVLSPDGAHVTFAAEDLVTGRAGLWVRTLEAEAPRLLEGTSGASRPFWSPDSAWIGFFADGRLKIVRLTGGPVTALSTVGPQAAGAAWSPRGQIIFSTWSSGLSMISASGGTPAKLTTLGDGQITHAWPQFLPDGDHFLYSSILRGAQPRIAVGRLSSPEIIPLIEADAGAVFAPDGYLVFTRNGVLTAQRFDPDTLSLSGEPFNVVAGRVESPNMTNGTLLSASRGGLLAFGGATGQSELAWFDRSGGRLGAIASPVPLHNPMLSADEKRVFANSYPPAQAGVWVADIERDATIRTIPEGSMPISTPDGRLLAFSANQSLGLFTRPLDGQPGSDETLVFGPERKFITDWSRDGRWMIYQAFGEGSANDLWALPLTGQRTATALLQTQANEIHGRLSPDGRWLAYASDESGRWEVYVQAFPGGTQRQTISPAGGSEPQWRADGRELFYLAEDHALMAVDITSGSTLGMGKPHVLFRPQVLGEPTTYRSHYAVSRDGQRILVDVAQTPALDPITVLVNWIQR